jgi:hypothetical protein
MLTTVSNIAIADDRWFSNFEVNKLQDDELNVLGFSKSGVTQGASGGPLFDDGYRLIGMVTEVSGVKATALKIDAILALLSSWHVPVNLLEAKRSGKAIVPVEESKKIAITDERGHSVAGLVQVAQRVAADGYAVVGKVSENSEKSTELAGLITVHMSLDVTVRNAGGAVAAHILLTSHGGGFQQEDARAQALERLVADFDERLAEEVP